MQTGERSGLLRPAIWRGISLLLPQVRAIHRALKLKELKNGQGTGKKEAVKKRDIVRQIVTHLFPECSDEDFWRMVDYIAPDTEGKPKEGNLESESDSLQYLVSCLDAENCAGFKNVSEKAKQDLIDKAMPRGKELATKELKKTLVNHLEEKIEKLDGELKRDVGPRSGGTLRSVGASSSRVGEVHERVTPHDFRSLFPFAGMGPGLSVKHDHSKKFAQVVFPCRLSQSCIWVILDS